MIPLLITTIVILTIIIGTRVYIRYHPQFGGRLNPVLLQRYALSPQWRNGRFENSMETVMEVNLKTLPGLLKEQFVGRKPRQPEQPIPMVGFDHNEFVSNGDKPSFIWYGHSVLLLRVNGVNLLIDPMLGSNAAPVAPFSVSRFSPKSLGVIDSLPEIEAILLTHDHYDHLDYHSIQKLKSKVSTYLVALGVGRHLEAWGIPKEQITEFDWWDETQFKGIDLRFTPSRHFSGRGTADRAKSLWGGWIFTTDKYNVYWSGDGGYGPHFKEIGDRFGPFDWAFMENGQYNWRWHGIHMYPEEAVQAAIDARTRVAIPVHWGGFNLSLHPWREPIERFVAHCRSNNQAYCTPQIGEIVHFGKPKTTHPWWEKN